MLNPTPAETMQPDALNAVPVRVAICGEVNAGKSTVINTLLRDNLIPDGLGRSSRPVIEVRPADAASVEVHHPDGRIEEARRLERSTTAGGAAKVVLGQTGEHLKGFEFIEVPLTRAEEVTDADRQLIASCDVMIWVTIASQAWRLTEKTLVEALGDSRPPLGILAVTRADKLRNDADRDRLRTRVVSETEALFCTCILINGARRLIANSRDNDKDWKATSGQDLLDALHDLGRQVQARAADATPEACEPAAEPDGKGPAKVLSLTDFRVIGTGAAPDAPGDGDDARDVTTDHPLRKMADTYFGASAIGIAPALAQAPVTVLSGDADRCDETARACMAFQQALSAALSFTGTECTVEAVALTTKAGDLLCQNVTEKRDTLFLLAESNRMSPGIARTALARLSHAHTASS